jgi:hypothetical protein
MLKQGGKPSSGAQLLERPEYIPKEYYPQILVVPAQQGKSDEGMFTCLSLGNSNVTVMVMPDPDASDGPKLTPVLQAIANSARPSSTLVYAPGTINLPVLGVTVTITSGAWGVKTVALPSPPSKQYDLLVRSTDPAELKLIPTLIDGICSVGLTAAPPRKNPRYVTAEWEPVALEVLRQQDPLNKLQLTVSRQISPTRALGVTVFYQSEQVPATDAPSIAAQLEQIAQAIIRDSKLSRLVQSDQCFHVKQRLPRATSRPNPIGPAKRDYRKVGIWPIRLLGHILRRGLLPLHLDRVVVMRPSV